MGLLMGKQAHEHVVDMKGKKVLIGIRITHGKLRRA